jgi:hypothetical protein
MNYCHPNKPARNPESTFSGNPCDIVEFVGGESPPQQNHEAASQNFSS